MSEYTYKCRAGHTTTANSRRLIACLICEHPVRRVYKAPMINTGGRPMSDHSPAVQQLLTGADDRRKRFEEHKDAYENEKKRIGRD